MGLNGKYVSIETVIEKVYRDYGFTDDLDWSDAIEWIGEAIDLIGVPQSYIDKTKCKAVENYRADIPCDLHQLIQVREATSLIPMLHTSDTYHLSDNSRTSDTSNKQCTNDCPDPNTSVPSDDDDDNKQCNPFFNFNSNPTTNTPFGPNQVSRTSVDKAVNLTYTVNNNFIFTSFKTGTIELTYKAFPTDNRGFPLIPNDIRYLRAVESYIAERIGLRLFIQDKMQPNKYDKLNQDWLFYVASAATKARTPSIDQMESWKNQALRLIPIINEHSNSFRFLNEQQDRYTHNSR